MSELNINITVQLSEKMEAQIERLINVLATAQHWQEDEDDLEDEDGATG